MGIADTEGGLKLLQTRLLQYHTINLVEMLTCTTVILGVGGDCITKKTLSFKKIAMNDNASLFHYQIA